MENSSEKDIDKEISQFMGKITDKCADLFLQDFADLLNSIRSKDKDYIAMLMASALCCCAMGILTKFCFVFCRQKLDGSLDKMSNEVAVNYFKDIMQRFQECLHNDDLLHHCIKVIETERIK